MRIPMVSKLKGALRSIDQQLRTQRAEYAELLRMFYQLQEREQSVETQLVQATAENRRLLAELEERLKDEQLKQNAVLNDRFYHVALDSVEKEMYLVNRLYPGNSKRYRELKDLHKGESCVIVGNGPSLRMEDLNRLQQVGVPTFASNRIYVAFQKTSWRPTYYMCQDFKMLQQHWQEMSRLEGCVCLFPHSIVYEFEEATEQKNAIFYPLKYKNPYPIWFSCNPDKVIHEGMTVTFSAMQIAALMGFSKIYLLGVDFNYPFITNEKGEKVLDRNQQTHFADNYYNKNEVIYQPNLDASLQAYQAAKEYGDANGIEIYNATRGGNLEVFPRVDFDEIFKSEQ